MFISFFYLLRARRLSVSLNEWLSLIEALDKGLCKASLLDFYHLCRSILVKSETDYDKFDLAFAEYFEGITTPERPLHCPVDLHCRSIGLVTNSHAQTLQRPPA